MWKAWAHPLWPGGEVWFRHYMLSQPRIKCANSRCCILGCVRCLFFFPPRLGCFLCSCASRAELFFFFYSHLPAWPSDSCSVCQLVTLGGSRRGEFDGGKKRKKKREGSSSGSASTSVSVVHPSCPWAQRGEKGFPYSLLNSFCLVHGGRKSVESRLCSSSVYLDPGFLCCSRTVPILHDLYLA